MSFFSFFKFLTQEIAIDLGTANTLIIHNDQVVVDEPSIVAIDRSTNKIVAVGKKAMMMHEKTHENLKTIRPLKDGVIADFNAAEGMLREMIKMVYPKKPMFPPSWRMVICIPSSITEVEKRAVRDSAEQAGAKEVYMIHFLRRKRLEQTDHTIFRAPTRCAKRSWRVESHSVFVKKAEQEAVWR